ncbi:MAG: tRNA (guanosine(46)-N7)-methyltransferase TrmB [Balneolaceae bacterium]
MGRKEKLKRIGEVEQFENVFEYADIREEHPLKGNWNRNVFKNEHPIVLELACGKGEYSLHLAQLYPKKNLIGVDIKGPRIWRGAKTALEQNITNVRFVRTFIDFLENFFGKEEVSDIWITFPDPYLKKSKAKKRLTSPKFLSIYRRVCKPGCTVNLKTDSPELFAFTLEVIEEEGLELLDRVDDVYAERPDDPVLTHKTHYEKQHLEAGRTIRFLKFRLFP